MTVRRGVIATVVVGSALLLMPLSDGVRARILPAGSAPGTILVSNVSQTPGRAWTTNQVLAVSGGRMRVLLHNSRFPYEAIAPSPDGRHVAFVACCFQHSQGVWVVNSDGTGLRRLLAVPRSPCGNSLGIESLAWSPGGHKLAYAVFINSDVIATCRTGIHDATGTWVTPFPSARPRRISAFTSTYGENSWSPDGRTLVISVERCSPTCPFYPVTTVPMVFAIGVTTGESQVLVRGSSHGLLAPVTGTLAYTTAPKRRGGPTVLWAAGMQGRHPLALAYIGSGKSTLDPFSLAWSRDGRRIAYVTQDLPRGPQPGPMALWVAGAQGHHTQRLTVNHGGPILSLAWSPDSRTIAYIGGSYACRCGMGGSLIDGTAVEKVDVAARAVQTLFYAGEPGIPLLSPTELTILAWLRTPSS